MIDQFVGVLKMSLLFMLVGFVVTFSTMLFYTFFEKRDTKKISDWYARFIWSGLIIAFIGALLLVISSIGIVIMKVAV